MARRHCSHGPKVRFDTEQAAVDVLVQLQADGQHDELRRAYLCPNCHGWHLTSQPLQRVVIPKMPPAARRQQRHRKW
jgi:hypothetical protein